MDRTCTRTGPGRHRSSQEAAGAHTAHGRVCARPVRPLERPLDSPEKVHCWSGHHRASPAVHSPGSTTGPYGDAECTACRLMMSMGWAGPSPAPSFALISPATITHDVCRRLVGAPGALSRASIRHASDTHDVATDAGHDGHTGGTIGIVLQHVECRPPCDLDHRARRAAR